MAIDQNTPPASAGKAIEAQRLISESLCTTHIIAAKLTKLQHCPDASRLGEEIRILQGITNYILDADCGLDTVLEDIED